MNKVIVLGNGYIGKKVYSYLSSTMTDFDVVTMSKYHYSDPGLLKQDLINSLRPEFNNYEQKWLINCVGYTGKPNVDACENDKQKCWDLNVTFPTILADFCLQNNIKVINISSGCIYDGTKIYSEEDDPNFGISNGDSSWYSKTKHAAELCLSAYPNVYTLRIRMPICNDFNSGKNYLAKLLKYNNLLQETNSKTVIEDLAPFLMHDVVQQWQLNFLIPGGILMDIGLLILAYLLIYGVFWLIDYLRGWRTKDGLEQRDIVLSLTFIIPGLILNYILGWIAHFINFVIS